MIRKIITIVVYVSGIGMYFLDYINTTSIPRASLAIQTSDGTQDIISRGDSPQLLLFFSAILSFVLVWSIATSVYKRSVAFVAALVGSILILIATFYIGDSNNSLGSDFGILPQLVLNCLVFSLFPLFYMGKNSLENIK